MIREILSLKKDEILKIAEKYGAHNIRIFGSAARGDDRPESDIDMLVELEENKNLLDQVGLMQELEELLGRRVDIVEPCALHWYVKDRILSEARPL